MPLDRSDHSKQDHRRNCTRASQGALKSVRELKSLCLLPKEVMIVSISGLVMEHISQFGEEIVQHSLLVGRYLRIQVVGSILSLTPSSYKEVHLTMSKCNIT